MSDQPATNNLSINNIVAFLDAQASDDDRLKILVELARRFCLGCGHKLDRLEQCECAAHLSDHKGYARYINGHWLIPKAG